ncbi:LrgB family protein [Thalassotalea euphylliae]|uniref:LrgB family protein n=1 Tax=Thalassotalea euphylliae TaxID=1655234 RepID=UPI003642E173
MIEWLSLSFVGFFLFTVGVYQVFAFIQQKSGWPWLNPMMMSMFVIIPALLFTSTSFEHYYQYTNIFSMLLEPAIVALGYPLYLQFKVIRTELFEVITALVVAIIIMLVVNTLFAVLLFQQDAIAVSLALKSVTTPIGLALTDQFDGIAAITAVAIIIAGIVGGVYGLSILKLCCIDDAKAQGLGVGCASHALGTACITPVSYQHGAFSSLALILSALLTALITPFVIPTILSFLANH